jgi:hypothetical protein
LAKSRQGHLAQGRAKMGCFNINSKNRDIWGAILQVATPRVATPRSPAFFWLVATPIATPMSATFIDQKIQDFSRKRINRTNNKRVKDKTLQKNI